MSPAQQVQHDVDERVAAVKAAGALIDRINRSLTNHPPESDAVVRRFEQVRQAAKHLGIAIAEATPPGREQSLAVTHLEETVMWAVKAIALNQGAVVAARP